MIRSGKEYHLFERFEEFSAVAPDLPELDISSGIPPIDDPTLDDQIKRARALRDWALLPFDRTEKMPSNDLADYESVPKRKQHGLFVNAAHEVLSGISQGSLIYVPNPTFLGDALFGEISSSEQPRLKFPGKGRMAPFTFQGRKLDGISRIPMKDLPKGLLELKSYRVGVTQLRRDDKFLLKAYPLHSGPTRC